MSRVELNWIEKSNPLIPVNYIVERKVNDGEWETLTNPIESTLNKHKLIDDSVESLIDKFSDTLLQYRVNSSSLNHTSVMNDVSLTIDAPYSLDTLVPDNATDRLTYAIIVSNDIVDDLIETPILTDILASLYVMIDGVKYTRDELVDVFDLFFTTSNDPLEGMSVNAGYTAVDLVSLVSKVDEQMRFVVGIEVPEEYIGDIRLQCYGNGSIYSYDENFTIYGAYFLEAIPVVVPPEEGEPPEEGGGEEPTPEEPAPEEP